MWSALSGFIGQDSTTKVKLLRDETLSSAALAPKESTGIAAAAVERTARAVSFFYFQVYFFWDASVVPAAFASSLAAWHPFIK